MLRKCEGYVKVLSNGGVHKMMTWNHRLILKDVSCPSEPWYELHEVFYDANKKPELWTNGPIAICGNSKKEVMNILLDMARNVHKHPVLKESQMPGIKKLPEQVA